MSNTEKDQAGPASNFPRRKFVSAALLGGVGLLAQAEIKAQPKDICSELVGLPTPADALVDLFDFLSGIESGILGPYYGVVGKISAEISTTYAELRKAASEFRRLVPSLRAGIDVPRFQNMTKIGMVSAAFIGGSLPAASNPLSIDEHSQVVKLASSDLEQTVRNWTSGSDSLTLSSEAVEKLREMLKLIAGLEKPTNDLNTASAALTRASEQVRIQIGQIKPLIKDATRFLIAAEILESPPPSNSDPNSDATAIVLKKLAGNKEPTTVAGLRTLAVAKLRESSRKLDELSRYSVPNELSQRLSPSEVASRTSNTMPIDVLREILNGTVSWIERGNEKPQQVSMRTGDGVRFMPASMTYSRGWFWDLWGQIRGVVAEQIPQASSGRVRQLYIRKLAISIYSVAKQESIFFNLLPYLAQPSDVDLWADEGLRRRAAAKLARL